MEKSKSMVWRTLLVLFIAFLWGGGVGAYAEEKAWVKYANGTLTFQYGEKGSLDEGEYDLNSGESLPGWNDNGASITKVVFDASFADARPTTCHSWFLGLENLTAIEGMDHLNTSEVTSMYQMFSGCKSLPSLDLSHFATQKVKTMSYMFMGCESLESLDLNSFNTAMVETMGYMFSGCTNLVTLDLTSFNTPRVTSTRRMFSNDSKLKTVYASDNFSLSAVTSERNHSDMFYNCVSLEGERKFIDNGRTDKVFAKSNDGYFLDKTMYRPWAEYGDGTLTFYYGYKRNIYSDQYKLYTSGQQWKPGWIADHSAEITKVVFDKSFAEARPVYCYGWFSGCEHLSEIVGSMYLNTSEVYDMGSMFEGCTALSSLDLSHFATQKVTEMSKMFSGCSNLAAIYASDNFVLSAVTSDADMFAGCENLKGDIAYNASSVDKTYAKNKDGYFLNGANIRPWAKYDGGVLTFYYGYKPVLGEGEYEMNAGTNFPRWIDNHDADITKVVFDKSFADARPTTCYNWFYYCCNLTAIEGLEYLNTSEVKSMKAMFKGCSSLTALDLSHFDTQNVTDMSSMFHWCTFLATLYLSSFNTNKVTDMSSMFTECRSLTSLDLSNFDTQYVKYMSNMFNSCKALTTLNVSKFDTRNVSDMRYMFELCNSLTSLDISNFDTQNVWSMLQMFSYSNRLQTIYASESFVVKEGVSNEKMFEGCDNLYGDIAFDANYTDKTYAKLEGGYFTHKEYTRPWVKYADGTLTFRYGYKKELDKNEYLVNADTSAPGWVREHTWAYGGSDDIIKAVFDKSFSHCLPAHCNSWFDMCQKLTTIEGIENLNTSKATSMSYMFESCTSLKSLDLSHFDTRKVASMSNMFLNCTGLTSLDFSTFDTPQLENMSGMFRGCTGLKSLDLSKFDTGKVKYFNELFYGCTSLESVNLSSFDTQNAEEMGSMFYNCSGLKSLNISGFRTQKVNNISQMFAGCSALTDLDLSNFEISEAGNYESLFEGCANLTKLDLSYFNTENAYNLSQMFAGCSNLATIYATSAFSISENAETYGMFEGCTKLKGDIAFDDNYTDKTYAKISNGYFLVSPDAKPWVGLVDGTLTFRFGAKKSLGENEFWLNSGKEEPGWRKLYKNITRVVISKSFAQARPTSCYKWFVGKTISAIEGLEWLNTSEVTVMQLMFWSLSLNSLDLSNFDTSKVTDMWCMFAYSSGLTSLDLSNFDTSNVVDMGGMFQDCSSLTSLDLSNFDTSKVTDMGGMFYNCSSLDSLNLSNFNTSNVVDMGGMFQDCSSLTSLDLSNFDTSKVTDMQQMFYNCSSLTSLNLSNFDTSKVMDMFAMFGNCSSLTSLDLSNFDTSKVTYMSYMFGNCSSLTSLDLSYFDTSNVTDMSSMFCNCSSLTSLDLSYFDTSNVTSTEYMFWLCTKLSTIYASDAFDVSNVVASDYMFEACESLKGDIPYNGWSNDKTYATIHDGYFLASPDVKPWVKYADGTLTFKYGKKEELDENEYWLNEEWEKPSWLDCPIKSVVFDKSFAVARPTSCYNWFYYLTSLTNIDGIEYLNTSRVTDMASMFSGCSALTSLDLSSFNTKNVTYMYGMFWGCKNLKAIYLGENYVTDNVVSYDLMFCPDYPTVIYSLPNKFEATKSSGVFAGRIVKPYVSINSQADYGTLCVPVGSSLTAGSFTGFDKLYQVENADKDKGTITLVEAKSIESGVPYVYHRYLEGVDFEGENDMSVITFDVDKNASSSVTAPKNENSLLKGTFESMVAKGGSYILQTDGNFHPVAEGNMTLKVGAYRAYLDLSSTEIGGGDEGFGDAKAYRMVFEDGEATGIDRINGDDTDKEVYDQADQQPKVYFDLMGRKVAAPLKGEIYIVNGKKVVYNK